MHSHQKGWVAKEDSSVVLSFMDRPRAWILNNLLKGIWKKCQSCEQQGMITQQADGLGFCSTGFPQGMWQLLNVFISAVRKMHFCTGFVPPPPLPPQVLLLPFQRVQSGFCSLYSFRLLPHQLKSANSGYARAGKVERYQLLCWQICRCSGPFFFFFLIKQYFFFFNPGTETRKLLADGATAKRSLFEIHLIV